MKFPIISCTNCERPFWLAAQQMASLVALVWAAAAELVLLERPAAVQPFTRGRIADRDRPSRRLT